MSLGDFLLTGVQIVKNFVFAGYLFMSCGIFELNLKTQNYFMKYILSLLLLISGVTFTNAQTGKDAFPAADDILELKQTVHDFGKIPQGKPVYTNFEIVNIGKEPLTLKSVQASCGCTTPEWSHEPIAPGATSIIKVGYNAATENHFEKTITITYNGDKTRILTIKGEVWKAPAGSAPANSSIQILKQSNN